MYIGAFHLFSAAKLTSFFCYRPAEGKVVDIKIPLVREAKKLASNLCLASEDPAGCKAEIMSVWPRLGQAIYSNFLEDAADLCFGLGNCPAVDEMPCEERAERIWTMLASQAADIQEFAKKVSLLYYETTLILNVKLMCAVQHNFVFKELGYPWLGYTYV